MTVVSLEREVPAAARLVITAFLIAALAGTISWALLSPGISALGAGDGYAGERMLLLYSALPRLAMALASGAALGLSGTLLQTVLRNPLASPSTLGVSAGANLALALAALYLPGLFGLGRDLVALGGSAIAAGIVLAIGARRDFAPLSLILAGLIVGLWSGALAAMLILLNDRYLASLFIWGAGSLSQQSWSPFLELLPELAGCIIIVALIARPLALIDAGDNAARSVGANVRLLRIVAVSTGVTLAALVTAKTGVIGFVGLLAPALARLAGARRGQAVLLWSAVFGGLILWLTDATVQLAAGPLGEFVPAGTVTAIIGAPLLLFMMRFQQTRMRINPAASRARTVRMHVARWPWVVVVCLAAFLVAGLFVGRAPDGDWVFLGGVHSGDILALRIPRQVAALAAGAMFATAGVILQRLTGNDLASPEVLGVNAGAATGVTLLIFLVASPGTGLQFTFAAGGGLAVLAVIFLLGARGRFEPERVLLAGVALSALVDAVAGMIAVSGDPRAGFLLRWMSGSTSNTGLELAVSTALIGMVLIAAAFAMHRWLEIIPIGAQSAQSVGIGLGKARFLLFLIAGLLSAAAALAAGPLSFAGLMGPHIAREAGFRRAGAQIAGAALAGAAIMSLADFVSRTLAYPYELPAGLMAALLGAPLLLFLMRR